MSFQAPFNPLALREMNMQEQQQRYNQQMGAVNSITGALAQIGGMALEMEQKKQDDQAAYGALQAIGQMFPGFGKTVKALDQLDEGTRYMAARSVLGNIGAISQLGIAGMRSEQAPALQAQRTTDQRNLMYEREQLARERQMMNTPQTPPPITVPTGMRRFNTGGI